MKIDAQRATVHRLLRAERARVFAAFGSAKALAAWFTPDAGISLEVLDFNFVEGGAFRLRYTMPDGTQPVVGGEYRVIDEPGEIVFSWVWEAPDIHAGIDTVVTVRLSDKGGQTEVVVTHDRLPSREACERHALGWEGILNRLETALETTSEVTSGKGKAQGALHA